MKAKVNAILKFMQHFQSQNFLLESTNLKVKKNVPEFLIKKKKPFSGEKIEPDQLNFNDFERKIFFWVNLGSKLLVEPYF